MIENDALIYAGTDKFFLLHEFIDHVCQKSVGVVIKVEVIDEITVSKPETLRLQLFFQIHNVHVWIFDIPYIVDKW